MAVDYRGEAYALSRWSGVKAKNVAARFKDSNPLPSGDDQRQKIAGLVADNLRDHKKQLEDGYKRLRPTLELRRTQMVERHQIERNGLAELHKSREAREAAARAARLPQKRPHATLDLERYRSMMDGYECSDEQKERIIMVLVSIALEFSDLGFGMSVHQLACGQVAESEGFCGVAEQDVLWSAASTLT